MTQTLRICIVPGCESNSTSRPDLSFHIFPKSRDSLMRWLGNLNMLELKDKPYSWLHNKYICSDHFDVSQYSYPGSGKLNRNAIPRSNHQCQVHIDFNGSKALNELPILVDPVPGPSYVEMDTWSPPEIIEDSSNDSNEPVQITTITERLREKDVRRVADKDSRIFIVKKVIPLIRQRQSSVEPLFKSRDLSEIQSDQLYTYLNKIGQMSKRIQIFFESKIRKLQNKRIVRQFSKNEKAFLLALQYQNPVVYGYISKIFGLPSPQSLNKAVSFVTQRAGIDDRIFWYLNEASERHKPEDRYCVLLFDEMPLKPELAFNIKEDVVEGLEDFGSGRGSRIVDTCFLFMIRGLAQRWKQPIAFYFVQSSTKTEALKLCILQVVKALHAKTKFRIVASVSDLDSTNCDALQSLCDSYGGEDEFVYNVDGHDIIHLFDVPHIIKNIRNCLLKRNIIFDGDRQAKWSDITLAYEADAGIPFGNLTKLTSAHIVPEGSQKFNVCLAVQVFSRNTYTVLMFGSNLSGIMQAHDTADFVLFVNDVFDSLNSDVRGTGRLTQPLSEKSSHFKFWNEAIEKMQTWTYFCKGNKRATPVAVPFLISTIKNVKLLWRYLKTLDFKFLQTRLLTQDPLENLIGAIRLLCQGRRRPTCTQFLTAYHLTVINTALQGSAYSNCESDGDAYLLLLQAHLPAVSCPPSRREPIYDKNFCALIAKIKLHTNSYMAGFLCRNLLNLNCPLCVQSFLTAHCTDSHTSIPFRGKNSQRIKLYPSSVLIAEIDRLKTELWDILVQNLWKENILSELTEIVQVNLSSKCEEHSKTFYKSIVLVLSYIMLKKFLKCINGKLRRKETRPNKVIDEYLLNNAL